MDRNLNYTNLSALSGSLSARRAWIEIGSDPGIYNRAVVALRKESVDRNCCASWAWASREVALRKESVDRNVNTDDALGGIVESLSARRAWIEISIATALSRRSASLSARRAWIEI